MIALPLSPAETATEAAERNRIGGAEWILRTEDDGFALKRIANSSRRSPLFGTLEVAGHAGLILFSSGTSGEPKAMLHDFNALLDRYQSVGKRRDRTLQLLLVDHIGGLDSALRTLCSGACLIIPETRTPEAVGRAIEQHGINILPASPTFLNLILLADVPARFDCSTVEIIAYGAEAMPHTLLERLCRAFPNAELQQKFGTSETGTVRIKSSASDSLFFKIADRETEWKAVNDELWLKTPSRILGYLNAHNDSLEAEGWYRTGDLVEEQSDGSLRIVGRVSTVINVGGQKVHPSEIENVLLEIPEIATCQVYSIKDPITGHRIACRIASETERDIRQWKRLIRNHCRGKLSPWKIPSSVEILNNIGMTSRLKQHNSGHDTAPTDQL